MKTLLVTGAGGLVGSAVCAQALERGDRVRALVRPGSGDAALRALGAEPVTGDVADADAVRAAAMGADAIVHTAALLGGSWATADAGAFERVNLGGTRNVLDAAAAVGAQVVALGTTAFLHRGRPQPIDEQTPLAAPNPDPYAASKRAAHVLCMERAAAGQDVRVVLPGGVYGPAPDLASATRPTSFNGALLLALRGELPRYPPVKLGWVLGADVARVALLALERGEAGRRYHALGDVRDATTVPAFLSLGCELAGVPQRVAATGSPSQEPELLEEFGQMARTADTTWPEPLFDSSATDAALGHTPVRLRDGLQQTLDWLAAAGELPRPQESP